MSKQISVKDIKVTIIEKNSQEFICLTDMVRNMQNSHIIIGNWLRNKDTLEYVGIWERINNPNFKLIEFDEFKNRAGTNSFAISPQQFIGKTSAIGLLSKSGRYGGTYAHKDIGLHFAMWISPEFQLLVVKEFQRLKEEESKARNLEWDYSRFLSKVNHKLHTDSIKENIIPKYPHLKKEEEVYIYANEAEMLNMAVFGITSKQWKSGHPEFVSKGLNIRDIANIPQLTVLANLENYNSILVKQGMHIKERFIKLKEEAVMQLKSLSEYKFIHPIASPHIISAKASDLKKGIKGTN